MLRGRNAPRRAGDIFCASDSLNENGRGWI